MKEQICKAFCNGITVREVPAGLAISTIFTGSDGDPIGFYIRKNPANSMFSIEENGMIYPSLDANIDLQGGPRLEALHDLQNEYGVVLDEDEKEFHIENIAEHDLPYQAMKFVSFLLRVGDLALLNETRVASTFHHDVEKMLRETVGDKAIIAERTPISSRLTDFVPDFVITANGRPPVALFLGASDARVLEALFIQMRAQYEVKEPCSVIALLEHGKSVTRTVRQQAANRLNAVAEFRGDEVAAIQRIAKEAIGSQYVAH